jgi:1,4-dihydroxy-2-naphthoate octaprenyltransferase
MVLGTQYAIAETLSLGGLTLSVLLGLGPSIVIFGKHIDKADLDREKAMRTLPVRLGERDSRSVLAAITVLQFPVLILACVTDHLPWPTLLALLSLPSAWRLVRCTRAPRPESRPAEVSEAQWPLWFVAYGFDHTRRFGPLLLLGLLLSTVF